MTSSSSIPLAALIGLFSCLFASGMLLTLPLYGFDLHKFVRTKLFIKIVFWIPIFLVFIGLLYMANNLRLVVWLALIGLAFRELRQVLGALTKHGLAPLVYYLLFMVALLHFYILGLVYKQQFINLMVTIGFASVLSDVAAFFIGNYWGKHRLPTILNKNKSWEGVAGQLIGAWLGVGLVNIFVVPVATLWLFLPIGLGAITGDLANSYVKRQLNLKDWSNSIPGHGGYLDRLASLAGSALMTFYFLELFVS